MGLFRKKQKAITDYPQIGGRHKNGDRMFGLAGEYARVMAERGTPKASSLLKTSTTPLIESVRVGDQLRVEWDGRHWWVSLAEGRVGRLTWYIGLRTNVGNVDGPSPYDFDDGTLNVETVTINTEGVVVDVGGVVVPD